MATNIINRADAEAIIRQQIVEHVFQDAPKQSTFMSMAKKLPNMTSNQTRIRVLDFLPTAFWVRRRYRHEADQPPGVGQRISGCCGAGRYRADLRRRYWTDAEFDIFGEVTPRVYGGYRSESRLLQSFSA